MRFLYKKSIEQIAHYGSHIIMKILHCIYTATVDPHVWMQMFSRGTSYVADVANGPPVLHLLNGGDADAVTMCIPKSFDI